MIRGFCLGLRSGRLLSRRAAFQFLVRKTQVYVDTKRGQIYETRG